MELIQIDCAGRENSCTCRECIATHRLNGCSFGRPDGWDDYQKDCDCD